MGSLFGVGFRIKKQLTKSTQGQNVLRHQLLDTFCQACGACVREAFLDDGGKLEIVRIVEKSYIHRREGRGLRLVRSPPDLKRGRIWLFGSGSCRGGRERSPALQADRKLGRSRAAWCGHWMGHHNAPLVFQVCKGICVMPPLCVCVCVCVWWCLVEECLVRCGVVLI